MQVSGHQHKVSSRSPLTGCPVGRTRTGSVVHSIDCLEDHESRSQCRRVTGSGSAQTPRSLWTRVTPAVMCSCRAAEVGAAVPQHLRASHGVQRPLVPVRRCGGAWPGTSRAMRCTPSRLPRRPRRRAGPAAGGAWAGRRHTVRPDSSSLAAPVRERGGSDTPILAASSDACSSAVGSAAHPQRRDSVLGSRLAQPPNHRPRVRHQPSQVARRSAVCTAVGEGHHPRSGAVQSFQRGL